MPYTDLHYSMKRNAHQNMSLSFFISYILPFAVRQLFRAAFAFCLPSSCLIAFLSSLLHYCVTLLRPPHCSAYDTLRYTRYGYSCNGDIYFLSKYLIFKKQMVLFDGQNVGLRRYFLTFKIERVNIEYCIRQRDYSNKQRMSILIHVKMKQVKLTLGQQK